MRTHETRHNRSQNLGAGRLAAARRTAYLARAYACHEMAASAEDARDQRALRAMTVLWQALAQRASAKQS